MSSPLNPRLSRKEVAHAFGRDRITVWRWEREGLQFLDGFITEPEVAWFLELRDCARTLGLETVEILNLSRHDQSLHLTLAFNIRTRRDATSCNIAEGDNSPPAGS